VEEAEMVTRHRRARRDIPESGNDGGDVNMGDVSDATLPEAVPRNPDGSASEEGEVGEEQAQLIGALSLESAAKNKGIARKLRDKALGKKGVPWNVDDALEMFSYVRHVFAHEWNAITVHITRTEPAPRFQLPPIPAVNLKDPQGLYDYIDRHHGTQGPATYKVYWRAGAGHERAAASLYMPDKSAPPVVQVISQPPQQPQQPQPPQQQGYPMYPGQYGGGYGGPGGGGPPGYGSPPAPSWPQQPPQPQQPQLVVISPPAPQQPQQAPPPAPPPAPIYMQPPPPAPGAFDPQRAVFEMMQAQNAQTMAALKEIVSELKKPSPPPGFISLPSEQYPVPPGFVRVPGGMIPAPPAYAPQGVGAVPAAPAQPTPVAYAIPAQVPVQAPAVMVQAPPQPTFDQQIAGTVGMMRGVVRGMGELQHIFSEFGPQARPPMEEELEQEPETPQAPNPIMTTDVGGITMAIDRSTGKTNWPATLMGAIPKVVDAAKSGLTEYQKIMDRNAAHAARLIQDRTAMANAIAVARGTVPAQPAALPAPAQPPAHQPPHPQPQQVAPPPPRAPQTAPVAPSPPPARKPAMPLPNGPIWG
jgi:hypothetical protein